MTQHCHEYNDASSHGNCGVSKLLVVSFAVVASAGVVVLIVGQRQDLVEEGPVAKPMPARGSMVACRRGKVALFLLGRSPFMAQVCWTVQVPLVGDVAVSTNVGIS